VKKSVQSNKYTRVTLDVCGEVLVETQYNVLTVRTGCTRSVVVYRIACSKWASLFVCGGCTDEAACPARTSVTSVTC